MERDPSNYYVDRAARRINDGRRPGYIPRRTHPKIYWSSDPGAHPFVNLYNVEDLLVAMKTPGKTPSTQSICIIQDIEREWAIEISQHMDLDYAFFKQARTMQDIQSFHPWVWATKSPPPGQRDEEDTPWRRIDGLYSPSDNVRTALSYYRIRNDICECAHSLCHVVQLTRADLFLVDSPPSFHRDKGVRQSRTCLRLPYSMDRVGLSLPSLLYSQPTRLTLLDFLQKAMAQPRPRDCLFIRTRTRSGHPSAVRAHPLLYMLADFAWTHNLQFLNDRVKKVSFENIQNPQRETATTMHGLREELNYLKAEVGNMIRHTPPDLILYFDSNDSANDMSYRPTGTPISPSQHIADDAKALEKFLTSSLELLMMSIALGDSERAERDSRRADRLTVLAAVYVPLSFVTGIFGMNLREVNDSPLPVWICLEVLGVVLLVTAAIVVIYTLLEKLRRKSKRSREAEDGFNEAYDRR